MNKLDGLFESNFDNKSNKISDTKKRIINETLESMVQCLFNGEIILPENIPRLLDNLIHILNLANSDTIQDINLRRWVYKTGIFFINPALNSIFIKHCKHNLAKEMDAENRSWIVAILYRNSDLDYEKLKKRDEFYLSNSTINLIELLFSRDRVSLDANLKRINTDKILRKNDIIELTWISFLFAYAGRATILLPNDIKNGLLPHIYELSKHDNDSVVQHILYALNYEATINAGSFKKDFFVQADNNINFADRWKYVLLWKDGTFVKENQDYIRQLLNPTFFRNMSLRNQLGIIKGLAENYRFNDDLFVSQLLLPIYMQDFSGINPYLVEIFKKNMELHPEFSIITQHPAKSGDRIAQQWKINERISLANLCVALANLLINALKIFSSSQ